MSKEQKAIEYAKSKSSAEVFRENHERDFLAGYDQALEDFNAVDAVKTLRVISVIHGEQPSLKFAKNAANKILNKIDNQ